MELSRRETVRFFMGRLDEWRKSWEVTDGAVKEGVMGRLVWMSGGRAGR